MNNKQVIRKRLSELSEEELLKGGKVIIRLNDKDYSLDFKIKKKDD